MGSCAHHLGALMFFFFSDGKNRKKSNKKLTLLGLSSLLSRSLVATKVFLHDAENKLIMYVHTLSEVQE
jgi:hypothetical protein